MVWATGPYSTAPGPRYRAGKLVVFAEDGFVYFRWDDGEKDVMKLEDAKLHRAEAAAQMEIWDQRKDDGGPGVDRAYAMDVYQEFRLHVEVMTAAIADAERQGDSENPEVRYKKMRDFLRSKRSGHGRAGGGPTADSLASALVFPVDYSSHRYSDQLPKPRQGALLVDPPETPS